MFGFDQSFKALADPNRRAILNALRDGPLNAGQIAERVGLAPNALSFHLRTLREAGLVVNRRQGKFIEYSLNTSVLEDLTRFFIDRLAVGRGNGIATNAPRGEGNAGLRAGSDVPDTDTRELRNQSDGTEGGS